MNEHVMPEGPEGPEGWESDAGAVVWVRGADYISGWSEAGEAAAEMNEALVALGLGQDLRAVPSTDGSGRAAVRLRGTPEAVAVAARMLRRAAV
jgi:hypothetical protein